MPDENDTYVVVGKPHRRVEDTDDDEERATAPGYETFSPGDEINPSEAELSAFPDRFEPAENLDPEASASDTSADDSAPGEAPEGASYTEEDIDAMSYEEKRRVASGVEGVDGRGSDEEITQGLMDHFSDDDSDDDDDGNGYGEE